ncbi:MAG: hypothetical protein PHO41_03485 [Eubacteriales bacterium]|nr:hypothetical protein [Eubacteriales bacterium]
MPFCKTCGTFYPNSMEVCPKCNAKVVQEQIEQAEAQAPSTMTEEEIKAARKKSWIQILIGVPAFIGLIYLLIWLMKIISGR